VALQNCGPFPSGFPLSNLSGTTAQSTSSAASTRESLPASNQYAEPIHSATKDCNVPQVTISQAEDIRTPQQALTTPLPTLANLAPITGSPLVLFPIRGPSNGHLPQLYLVQQGDAPYLPNPQNAVQFAADNPRAASSPANLGNGAPRKHFQLGKSAGRSAKKGKGFRRP
jgi:hypothetical protein